MIYRGRGQATSQAPRPFIYYCDFLIERLNKLGRFNFVIASPDVARGFGGKFSITSRGEKPHPAPARFKLTFVYDKNTKMRKLKDRCRVCENVDSLKMSGRIVIYLFLGSGWKG